ncbi:codeine O-demethylase-like [Papaver somniferum]|uniref:codeine O-demethylase-like n=1 Tax=Papaver somniferum TaxID=3469 RepID=UPI000E704392|nr:codeine O-demethylase-like [Papaver somniferum]
METPKIIKLAGSSLFVPSVQELVAKQSLVQVPPRYIRNDQEPLGDHNVTVTSMIDQSVPVIDLHKVLSPEPIGGELLERLHSASKNGVSFRW